MNDTPRIRRDVLMLLIGAAIATIFGILVAYPQILADSRENAANIESNKRQIERLWDAHEVWHKTPTSDGDSEQ